MPLLTALSFGVASVEDVEEDAEEKGATMFDARWTHASPSLGSGGRSDRPQ